MGDEEVVSLGHIHVPAELSAIWLQHKWKHLKHHHVLDTKESIAYAEMLVPPNVLALTIQL